MPEPIRLSSIKELDALLEASRQRPVLLFKHSLTCPVSATAHDAFRRFLERRRDGDCHFALVEVQRARRVADEIAERTGVRHESPQAILVRDGRAVWTASHWRIDEAALERALEEAGQRRAAAASSPTPRSNRRTSSGRAAASTEQ